MSPVADCTKYIGLISATLDGAATHEERADLEAHVAACERCQERLEGARALKHAVARLPGREKPPEAVQARIEALRFGPSGSHRQRWRRRAAVSAVAIAGALAAVVLGRSLTHREAEPTLADELIADHMKYVPEAMPAEVASEDPHEVRRFFDGKVPFDPVVPRLPGARLLGGRLCRIHGEREQLLFYERGGTKLSLYVSSRQRPTTCAGKSGYHVCGHEHGGLSWMLVGDAPEGDLRTLLSRASL